ncbi:hypothetical protein NPIL_658241 [Nephila pilipes]|uniref:Uncharacterized protein n=1 Tax=Nephila pilipes TaxID=299642 RepID=A0A8X6P0Z7_NEPPI|nr:hypothetical protein NPIL_658241 [Nephila pilipes]
MVGEIASISIRDSASATVLSQPLVYRMSVENWESDERLLRGRVLHVTTTSPGVGFPGRSRVKRLFRHFLETDSGTNTVSHRARPFSLLLGQLRCLQKSAISYRRAFNPSQKSYVTEQ